MQREITITILAEDIRNNSYFSANHCPITRALHRAGYSKLKDTGTIEGEFEGESIDINVKNKDYNDLLDKLFGMYNSKSGRNGHAHGSGKVAEPITIEDFTHTIRF